MNEILSVKDLRVEFSLNNHKFYAVDGVDFDLRENEIVVIAGESGSGKTITALSIINILPQNARIINGRIDFNGSNILGLSNEELVKIRSAKIAYIFQEPASYLNPVYTVGSQITEAIMLHQSLNKKEAYNNAIKLLQEVKISDPQRVFFSYPHQLSGGMNQRAFIAMSLACQPKILIADEPTTSLDVTIEAQIIKMLLDLQREINFSLLFITHNLSIARKIANRIFIMHKGKVVESGNTEDIFSNPRHFHTKELIAAYQKVGKI